MTSIFFLSKGYIATTPTLIILDILKNVPFVTSHTLKIQSCFRQSIRAKPQTRRFMHCLAERMHFHNVNRNDLGERI